MKLGEVRLWKLTRRQVREAMVAGEIKGAIIPTGSTEQHNEHLALEHDAASALHVSHHAALDLYPRVIVTPPVTVGISEHWMEFKGTLTAKPETFAALIYDMCDSLKRHGIEHILIVNGHAGNGAFQPYLEEVRPKLGIDVQFYSYWTAYSQEFIKEHMESGKAPAHAAEFETAFAMAAFPENVHWDGVDYEKANLTIKSESYAKEDPMAYVEARDFATAQKGRIMIDKAISWVADKMEEMMGGA